MKYVCTFENIDEIERDRKPLACQHKRDTNMTATYIYPIIQISSKACKHMIRYSPVPHIKNFALQNLKIHILRQWYYLLEA